MNYMPIGLAGTIDNALITEVVAVLKSFFGLFGEYPLNVFIILSIGIAAFGAFKHARNAVK